MNAETSYKNDSCFEKMLEFCEANLSPPTLRQLADAMGVKSTNAASNHIKRLIKAGKVERTPGAKAYAPVEWKRRLRACIKACAGINTNTLEVGRLVCDTRIVDAPLNVMEGSAKSQEVGS